MYRVTRPRWSRATKWFAFQGSGATKLPRSAIGPNARLKSSESLVAIFEMRNARFAHVSWYIQPHPFNYIIQPGAFAATIGPDRLRRRCYRVGKRR